MGISAIVPACPSVSRREPGLLGCPQEALLIPGLGVGCQGGKAWPLTSGTCPCPCRVPPRAVWAWL